MGEEGGEGGREGGENSDDREKSCQQEDEQGQGRRKNIRGCPVNRKDGWEKRRKREQTETGRAISNISVSYEFYGAARMWIRISPLPRTLSTIYVVAKPHPGRTILEIE